MTGAPAGASAPGAPGPAEPTETFRFSSADGTGLYGEFFSAPASPPRAAALILHGYAEHGGRYREVARVLADLGLAVLAFDLRGHGRAEGQRGHIERFSDYLDDARAALGELERRIPRSTPLCWVAHSNGALIALRMLADPAGCPPGVRAAVLSSPFLGLRARVPAVKSLLGKAASRVLPSLSLANEIAIEDLTHDPDKLAERRMDTLCHDVASARWYQETLDAQEWVRTYAHRVRVPTLWLVAGEDRLVDPEVTRAVHSRIRAPSVYRELPDMHHEVFNEVARARVFDLVRDFVEENFPAE